MNWQVVSAVSELLGAIAVILTLYYLARQFRDATTQALQDNFQHTVDNFSSSLENASVVRRGCVDFTSLTDDEAFLFNCLMWNMTHSIALIWEQNKKGLVSPFSYNRVMEVAAFYFAQRGYRQWFSNGGDENHAAYPPEMTREITTLSKKFTTTLFSRNAERVKNVG